MNSYGMDEKESRGRKFFEEVDPSRGLYERDIDRIVHSRAFKRLSGKTQVVTGRESDHHRTRLTHSIEVGTLCRDVARKLEINEDLAAAIGLSHDLGHPPLGHCGEEVLNDISREFGENFEHNRHTLFIVDEFEQKYVNFPGLNLSFEVREGIIKHSSRRKYEEFDEEFDFSLHPTLEAQLVDYCDEICYSYSDLDDGYELKLISLEDMLEELERFKKLFEKLKRKFHGADVKLLFNEVLRRLMSESVNNLIDKVLKNCKEYGIESVEDVRCAPKRMVEYESEHGIWISELKTFLMKHYYRHPRIVEKRNRYRDYIKKLFEFYYENEEKLPKKYVHMIRSGERPRYRVIIYYIAGFTDYYFLNKIREFGLL